MLPGMFVPMVVPSARFIGAQVHNDSLDNFSFTFSVAGASAGDLIVIAISVDNSGGSSFTWTGIDFTTAINRLDESDPGSFVGYAIWDGVETTIGTSGLDVSATSIVVSVFRGVSTLVNSATASGASGTPNGPSVSGSGTLHVATGHMQDDATPMTAPSGWELAGTEVQGSGTGSVTGVAYNLQGLNDPGAFGGGSNDWHAATLVFR